MSRQGGGWFAHIPEHSRYNALLHLVVLIWGFTGILGRLISLDTVPLVYYRVSIAVPAMVLFLLSRGVSLRMDRVGFLRIFGTGFLVALHWGLFFGSIKISVVSVALVCQSVAPFFTAFLEPIAYRRPIRAHELMLGVTATVGVAIIFGFETEYAAGIAVGLAASFTGALFTVMNGRFVVAGYDSRAISLYELMGAWVTIGAAALFVGGGRIPIPVNADLIYLAVLGIVCTAFAFMAGILVMRRLSPFTVILTTNLEPVYGIVLALLVFGESEQMSTGFYAGAALILASIWLNAIIVRRQMEPKGARPHGDRAADIDTER